MANIRKEIVYSVMTIRDVITGEVMKTEKRIGKIDKTKALIAYIKATGNAGVTCDIQKVTEIRVMSLESFIKNSTVVSTH